MSAWAARWQRYSFSTRSPSTSPPIRRFFALSEHQFGVWAALAIHDTISVVGATADDGPLPMRSKAATLGTCRLPMPCASGDRDMAGIIAHSPRIARTGSTFAARRAGAIQANSAVTARSADTPRNVSASVGDTR